MNYPAHDNHGQASDPHAGHKMADMPGGHDRHAGHSVAMFRDKFWLSFALTIPVVVWSSDVQQWFGYTVLSFPGSKLVPARPRNRGLHLWWPGFHPWGTARTSPKTHVRSSINTTPMLSRKNRQIPRL